MILIKEASFYQKKEDNNVLCLLCPHNCLISLGNRGLCRARVNKEGLLYSENYGKISSIGMDPIEKKPLYHFYPGSKILSVGTFGCNFTCGYCQNWQISQEKPSLKEVYPEQLIEMAKDRGAIGIAYTYSEPSIWYEYIRETAEKAKKEGLKNVMVSNGYISEEPLEEIIPYIDAANIDLKSFDNDFYRKLCSGKLEPVLRNIELLSKNDVHIELTTLIITDYNDSMSEIEQLFSWIHDLDPNIPIHLSRYFPNYKMKKPATSIDTMKKSYQVAQKYLNYVYLGNVNIEEGNTSYCPKCGDEIIKRSHYRGQSFLIDGKCPECNYNIYGRY